MSSFSVPITLFIFNRPDLTRKTFACIREMRPERLFVVADGPRLDRAGEDSLCLESREITKKIDWPCEVSYEFSDKNMGCKLRISSGVSWVFSHVDSSIFLEDDCIPEHSFFPFCRELLERYRDDDRVGAICGSSFSLGVIPSSDSYLFSKYPLVWGWASWRRAWTNYDPSILKWESLRQTDWLENVTLPEEREHWRKAFEAGYSGTIDAWSYSFVFMLWIQGQLSIHPTKNLISNVGFRADATHTIRENEFANMALSEMTFPLVHPVGFNRNLAMDAFYMERECRPKSPRPKCLRKRVKRWLKSHLFAGR